MTSVRTILLPIAALALLSAWEFEYEGGGRMCDVWIGDDGTIKLDEMHP